MTHAMSAVMAGDKEGRLSDFLDAIDPDIDEKQRSIDQTKEAKDFGIEIIEK